MGRDTLKELIQFVLESTYENWDGYYLSSTNPQWEENLIERLLNEYLQSIK